MSNRNYNKTGKPAFQSPGASAEIKAEFAAIDAGFAGVETELDGKAALSEMVAARAGEVNLNTRISLIKATLDQLGQTSLNSALPAQSGNAGKFIGTNGTNASWQDILLARLALTTVSSVTRNADSSLASVIYSTGEKAVFTRTAGRLDKVEYTATDGTTVSHTYTITRANGRFASGTWS